MKSIAHLLILFLVLMNPASNLVLCWGDDGHVAIEAKAQSPVCCDEIESKRFATAQELFFENEDPDQPDCSHCFDIPLTFHPTNKVFTKSANTILRNVEPSISASFLYPSLSQNHVQKQPRAYSDILRSHSLHSLKSIQLLI